MDKETKLFLRDCHIPAEMIKLLGVYGYNCIKDIAALNVDSFNEIEQKVRQKNFNGRIDPESTTDRKKFFGESAIDFNRFRILLGDRNKLLDAATATLGLLTVRDSLKTFETELDDEEEYQPEVSCESSNESDDSYESDGGSQNIEKQPPKKKAKLDVDPFQLKIEFEENFKVKGAKMMNKLLAKSECTQIAGPQHIQGTFDPATGIFSARCKCVLCPQWIACTSQKGSWTICNFKRHLTNVHLKPDLAQKTKKDQKKKIENSLASGSSSEISSQKLVTDESSHIKDVAAESSHIKVVAAESSHIKDEQVELVKCKPMNIATPASTSSTSFNEKKRKLPMSSTTRLMDLSIKLAKRQLPITKFFNKVPRTKLETQKLPETNFDEVP